MPADLRPGAAVLNLTPAVLPMAASAAAPKAAGDGAAARELLHRAAAQQHTHPTYYGGAWDALGPARLGTGMSGTC